MGRWVGWLADWILSAAVQSRTRRGDCVPECLEEVFSFVNWDIDKCTQQASGSLFVCVCVFVSLCVSPQSDHTLVSVSGLAGMDMSTQYRPNRVQMGPAAVLILAQPGPAECHKYFPLFRNGSALAAREGGW